MHAQPILCRTALSLMLGLATVVSLADDTELFVTGFDAPASCENPNVLFMIDTSRSMDSEVMTQVSWNPEQTFSGCFDSNSYYYSATGDLPDCNSISSFEFRSAVLVTSVLTS